MAEHALATEPVLSENSAESLRRSVIVAEEPTDPSSTLDASVGRPERFRCNDAIVKPLVVPLAVGSTPASLKFSEGA